MYDRRQGISLVELLVVIAIIGLLVSITIPAIQASREMGRRTGCINNLRQFGLALSSFESQHKAFPAGATVTIKGPVGNKPEIYAHNLITELLPFIEEDTIAKMYDRKALFCAEKNRAAIAKPISIALCASAPDRENPAAMSFMPSLLIKSPDPNLTKPILDALDANHAAKYDAALGDYTVAAHADRRLATRLGYKSLDSVRELPSMFPLPKSDELLNRVVPLLLTSAQVQLGTGLRATQLTDGLSRTFAMFEAAGKPQHWSHGMRTSIGEPLPNGWADPRIVIKIRPNDSDPDRLLNLDNDDHPFSFHPGGVNFVFADTHVEFLQEDMDPRVLLSLMTPDQGDNAQ